MKLYPLALLSLLFCFACLQDGLEVIEAGPVFSDAEFATISQELDISQTIDNFDIELAAHMSPNGRPASVDIDPAKALLGRVLFYDNRLSATGETNCSSCHKQELAFSDDLALSKGISGQFTRRNSLALAAVPNFETSYGQSTLSSVSSLSVQFFWDERAGSIQAQSRETIENEIEMGHEISALSRELNELEMYRILTRYAFGQEELTPFLITQALQDFCNSLVSANSRFDRLRDQELFGTQVNGEPSWTAQEQLGLSLYRQHCGSCHSNDMTTPGLAAADNGLIDTDDLGKGETFGAEFNGVFKVPFLRNIELTGPYMHDGRFETLEDVLDHYSLNIQLTDNLHPLLQDQDGQARRFNFSEAEKQAIIAFLQTTTDEKLPTEVRFSDPFRR